ncbi:MAG TPA: GNAT family N-acetyltransferase [Tepidisphaeraceae bacterium]|jgi:ribosomal protein S18 acetylase RimI-like enzyme|nr:GNAT family N-acetyltransferase [Tepidisphaeraceae bacterium]
MDIRAARSSDLDLLMDIDGTVESTQYLHLEQTGEGFKTSWALEERPLRSKLIESNALGDDLRFTLKQVLSGADDGVVMVVEHDEQITALALAKPEHEHGTMRLLDVRVDYDLRRQGLGMALVYQIIQKAREAELRAVTAETRTNNFPANQLLLKCGFDLGGVDTRRHTNHDMVKEAATLLWYAALD